MRLPIRFRVRTWPRSLHAKLFILMGLVTSLLTLAVAYTITENSRKEMLDYTLQLSIHTGTAIAGEIKEQDPLFLSKARLTEFLENLAGTDKSIDQIDVFRAEVYAEDAARSRVTLVTSSVPEEEVVWAPELGRHMNAPNPTSQLIELLPGDLDPGTDVGRKSRGWEVYVPIPNPAQGHPVIGLVRVYCDMERWEIVWENNLARTFRLLPFVLAGEFVLLWIILRALVDRPLKAITTAMARLEGGDSTARAGVARKDELGRIADRFNLMAAQLEKASREREALIAEVQALNVGLQERIDAALGELQGKNRELEELFRRIALLREELGKQERLAVAGQLTAAFAHEVGTPLNLVNGHLQLLMSRGDLDERTRERLGTIHTQITRVGDIVRKLLGNTRRQEIHPEPIPIPDLVADLQRLWGPTLAARRIEFRNEAPVGCVLLVDRKQMEQLFINLVNNAADAMPDGGEIRLQAARDGAAPESKPRWEIALEDTGTGIPADLLPKVFRPLFTTKPEGRGTGLGLAICREIVRAHGGEIRIESQEGHGTAIRFTLPGV